LFLLFVAPAYAQTFNNKYFVAFTDKDFSDYNLSNPEEFLSERAIQRRATHNIPYRYNDLPVSAYYTESLKEMGFHIYYTTKWFNGAVVGIDSASLVSALDSLSFIKSYDLIYTSELKSTAKHAIKNEGMQRQTPYSEIDYGPSVTQIKFNGGDYLHDAGLTGKGMYIAVLDAGFYNVDTLAAFKHLWEEDRILATRSFVNPQLPFFDSHTHGMYVLSLLGGWLPGELVGSAPDATYILLHTEDGYSENRIEEYNWAAGAEFADSIGADIINSSLGYHAFDIARHNYSYSDMDGNTAVITRAADIAASKGMLVVTSAGNEGNDPWKFITAPADADSVLTVGAADSLGFPAAFTSFGPTYDGRIKPNTTGMGVKDVVQSSFGGTSRGNGTSFSSPLIAGMAAGLWQKYPNASNIEIINAIEKSSSLYLNPDSMLGYGIADMAKAFTIASGIPQNKTLDEISIFPNPYTDSFTIETPVDLLPYTIEIINLQGKIVAKESYPAPASSFLQKDFNEFNNLGSGIYILTLSNKKNAVQRKIIKINKEK